MATTNALQAHGVTDCLYSEQQDLSTTKCKAYITIAIRLRYDYDTTVSRRIRLRRSRIVISITSVVVDATAS